MTSAAVEIRSMTAGDWPSVESILAEAIAGGDATFESSTPSWDPFDADRVPVPRLVAIDAGAVLGWAAASPVSARAVYRGVIEHSVYVAASTRGRGVGSALLNAFIADAEAAGYWMLQGSIFPENTASLALHERAGFRIVGRREAIGRSVVGSHAGCWRDTLLVERRFRPYR